MVLAKPEVFLKEGVFMKNNFNRSIVLTATLTFTLGALTACADKKIAEEKKADTSHNIFTGNNTVTEEKETTYQNRKSGAISKKKVKNEVKYDENGKKISESTESEKE